MCDLVIIIMLHKKVIVNGKNVDLLRFGRIAEFFYSCLANSNTHIYVYSLCVSLHVSLHLAVIILMLFRHFSV